LTTNIMTAISIIFIFMITKCMVTYDSIWFDLYDLATKTLTARACAQK